MLCASAIVHAMLCEPLLRSYTRCHRMFTIAAINRIKTKVQIINFALLKLLRTATEEKEGQRERERDAE